MHVVKSSEEAGYSFCFLLLIVHVVQTFSNNASDFDMLIPNWNLTTFVNNASYFDMLIPNWNLTTFVNSASDFDMLIPNWNVTFFNLTLLLQLSISEMLSVEFKSV